MKMDTASTIDPYADQRVDQRIAQRVRTLRGTRGLSLDALAAQCGVSRSMISRIERAQSSPTAVLLERIATGLDVSLASLFEDPRPAGDPVARRASQLSWQDPVSGYLRRNISPSAIASPVQIVEVSFPPLARVAYETSARETRNHQQVWLLEGSIDITVGRQRHRLRAGDCLALVLDQPMMFHNPGRTTARYAVVLASEHGTRN